MPLGPVHHVSISVTDMGRSIAFYRDVLGFRLTMQTTVSDPEHDLYLRLPEGTSAQVAILQAGSVTIGEVELIQWSFPSSPPSATPAKRPGDPGPFLLAFEVTGEELETACQRMTQQGVKFWSDPITSHIDGYGAIRAVVCEDPDGTMIELLTLPSREEIVRTRTAYLNRRQAP
ncbi:MAG: VOC family protein [bacterium]|nr:VOC family protein [Acidimicrobiia bacterium]MCY4649806.1 VOC family protein [bacterium]